MAAFRYIQVEGARWRSAAGELLLALWSAGALGFAWLILTLCLIAAVRPAQAREAASESEEQIQAAPDEIYALHAQLTYVEQEVGSFRAPYAGPNSLTQRAGRETVDVTLFAGVRLWHGAELWVTPEGDQGFGLDNTLGIAGFPSGEAYKVGENQPYFRLPRAFVRQELDVGAEREAVDGAANQLAGSRSLDRWVITFGKFSVPDIFDTNRYAHDPRADFLNWSAVDAGSFDYAADAWGYTVGAAAERYLKAWAFRAGVFDLSNVPNSPDLEPAFHEFQMVAEIERRYALLGQTGRVMVTAFDSRGRMALLGDAIAYGELTGGAPELAPVRRYRSRLGASLDVEQPLSADVGLFARVGKAQGNVETYEFTDIDRSVSVGTSIAGNLWRRLRDSVGVVAIDNGISGERERYLAAGGLGVLVGDGRLPHPGAEQILEAYYGIGLGSHVTVSLDYQHVRNPAYNTDRGPVSIGALRLHAQF